MQMQVAVRRFASYTDGRPYVRLTFQLDQLREMFAGGDNVELAPLELIRAVADLLDGPGIIAYRTPEMDEYDPDTGECHLFVRISLMRKWTQRHGPRALNLLESRAGPGNVTFVREKADIPRALLKSPLQITLTPHPRHSDGNCYMQLSFEADQLFNAFGGLAAHRDNPERMLEPLRELLSQADAQMYEPSPLNRYDRRAHQLHIFARLDGIDAWEFLYEAPTYAVFSKDPRFPRGAGFLYPREQPRS